MRLQRVQSAFCRPAPALTARRAVPVPMPAMSFLEHADPAANARRWLAGELAGAGPTVHHRALSRFYLPVHGTSIERCLAILKEGQLVSYRMLRHEYPPELTDSESTFTDILDREIGTDRYVFLNWGRVNPGEIRRVYFCFPNQLLEQRGCLAALREIVMFGTYVSAQSAEVARQQGITDVEARNRRGTEQYLRNVFTGRIFLDEIFPRFLRRYYQHPGEYLMNLFYPGADMQARDLGMGRIKVIENAWDGPQIMIPDAISLAQFPPVLLVASTAPGDMQAILDSGFPPERIFYMAEVAPHYARAFPQSSGYDHPMDQFKYINLALRDLSLLGRLNRTGETYARSMFGFHHRIDPLSFPDV